MSFPSILNHPQASEYFKSVSERQFDLTFNSFNKGDDSLWKADHKLFSSLKRSYKDDYSRLRDWSHLSSSEIKSCALNYILCNQVLGLLLQHKAHENRLNGIRDANDGRFVQHWIPECYLKAWTQNIPSYGKRIRKVEQYTLKRRQKFSEDNRLLIPLSSADFCERKNLKGRVYSPQFEIVLSQIEYDYGQLPKTLQPARNFWEFLVLTTFFLVFAKRTKEYMELIRQPDPISHSDRKQVVDLTPNMVLLLPEAIGNMEIYSYHRSSIIPQTKAQKGSSSEGAKPFRFPFNQHPIHHEQEYSGTTKISSFWCIYTPDWFLWLRDKRSVLTNPLPYDTATWKMMQALEHNGLRDLYFHPDDPVWNFSPTSNTIGFVPLPLEKGKE